MSQLAAPHVADPPRADAPPGPAASPRRRTPLTVGEELFVALDRPDEPSTIYLEARVSGSLDESKLRAAVAAAVALHPMMRARLGSRRFLLRRPRWEVVEPADPPAFEAVSCDDDADMVALRSAFCSRPIDLSRAPSLRALLVRRPGGDSLALGIHHAACDGIAALRLMNSIAKAYAGQPDPVPADVDPLSARDIRDYLIQPDPKAYDPPVIAGGTGDHIAPDGASDAPGFGLCCAALPADRCKKLDPRRFGPDATLNDVLLAALHLTIDRWNADRDRPCGRIAVLVPINPRPAAWSNEVVANIVYAPLNLTTPADRASPASTVSIATAQMQRLKLGLGVPKIYRRPLWLYRLISLALGPLLYVKPERSRSIGLAISAVLSNLGRVERKVSGFGAEGGRIEEVWPSPPVQMPAGVSLGSAIVGGRLHIALRHRLALMDSRAAHSLLALYLDQVERLGIAEG